MLILDQRDIKKYYKALVDKDEKYIGVFFVGVKTTGIFCISTCRARKPKFENVEFYTETRELLQHGYRPCKICKPTQNANQPPEEVMEALALFKQQPANKISDHELKLRGVNPENVRRWFKKHHGITFQAYQRMIRINTAYQDLKNGKSVTDAAYDSGYDSLSGFGHSFKKVLGSAPKNSKNRKVVLIDRITTPLGPMYIGATDRGICLLEFTDRRMLETEFKELTRRLNASILTGENAHILQMKTELEEYFDGRRQKFEVALDAPGTDFQRSVWAALQTIEYGKTCSYQEQAEKINNHKAVRAVASANGHNRIAIVIPCHRVIGKDGSLTGYGGGLERKRWLLAHERRQLRLPL